jgi:hypothetical protein
MLSSALAIASAQSTVQEGHIRGDFELLGSLCFPEEDGNGQVAVMNFNIDSAVTGVTIHLFDDEPDSFPSLNDSNKTCAQKIQDHAKTLHYGGSDEKGIKLEKGSNSKEVRITEAGSRVWYYVATKCDADDDGDDVQLDSWEIWSEQAMNCAHMWDHAGAGGFNVAIVFLVIIAVALVGASIFFWRNSRKGPALEEGSLTYSEL